MEAVARSLALRELERRGVSVHHLKVPATSISRMVLMKCCSQETFLRRVIESGGSAESKIYEVEEGVIRAQGSDVVCPRDGKVGSAYCDAITAEDVGPADMMLSYTWSKPRC